jgi:rubrerythrin
MDKAQKQFVSSLKARLLSKGGSKMDTLSTASAVISFVEKLEDESSKFYGKLAESFEKEIFSVFAKEGVENKCLIRRTYQENISDALEACFTFRVFNQQKYLITIDLLKTISYSNALKLAIELEERNFKFYMELVNQSTSLLASLSRVFRKIAERRNSRKQKLVSLMNSIIKRSP